MARWWPHLTVGVLVAVFVGLALVGLVNATPIDPSSLGWLLSFAVMAVVGSLIIKAVPRHRTGLFFLLGGLGTPVAALLEQLGLLLGSVAMQTIAMMIFGAAWVAASCCAVLYVPDNRLPSPRWRGVVWLAGLVVLLTCAAVAVNPQRIAEDSVTVSPWGLAFLGELPAQALLILQIAAGMLTVLAGLSVIARWRAGDAATRSRLAWLVLAALLMIMVAVLGWLLPARPDVVGAVGESIQVVAVPVATLIAIRRHRLLDIDLVLRRSLVYFLLAAVVAAIFAATFAVTTRWAVSAAGPDAGAAARAAVITGVVVAIVLLPLQRRLDGAVERILFGHRDVSTVFADLGAIHGPDADPLVPATQAIARALEVEEVRIVPARTASHDATGSGDAGSGLEIPLRALGEYEGVLLIGPRRDGTTMGARDRALITTVADPIALLVRSQRLARDLQGSRERLVSAREAERVHLRRDLHDGLGPVLGGLTLQVDSLTRWTDDPEALALIERIKAEVRQAIGALREALEGLRPTDLDQLGLAEALTERARSLSAGAVQVRVDCPPDVRSGPAAEVAAYRIAGEAMTNAVRHAHAQHCAVTITESAGEIEVSVTDDGIGFTEVSHPRVGLESIRQRAEELGGCWSMGPGESGGTAVVVRLPNGAAP